MFGYRLYPGERHPLVRLLAIVVGAAGLIVVVAFGFFAAVAIAIGGAAFMLINALRNAPRRTAPQRPTQAAPAAQAPAGVIEGEFKVVRETPAHN